jgi:hypothetical protein
VTTHFSDVDPSNQFIIVGGSNTLNSPGVVLAHDTNRRAPLANGAASRGT